MVARDITYIYFKFYHKSIFPKRVCSLGRPCYLTSVQSKLTSPETFSLSVRFHRSDSMSNLREAKSESLARKSNEYATR